MLISTLVQSNAVLCRKNNGQWGIGVLISSLLPQTVLALTGQPIVNASEPLAVLLVYVYFYDLRSGGVETEIKEDKQGWGTSKRNKKRFDVQYLVNLLEALAHNILVWTRHWLAPLCPQVAQFCMLRLVWDAFHMNGLIVLHQASSHIVKIVLNQADPLAKELYAGFAALFAQEQFAITLGET